MSSGGLSSLESSVYAFLHSLIVYVKSNPNFHVTAGQCNLQVHLQLSWRSLGIGA